MRRVLFTLLALLLPLSCATQEVVAPRVRVLYDDPALASYAQRAALEAEAALDTLISLFGFAPPPITLRVEGGTDIYNAFAAPLPRPSVGVRALFPTETPLGYGSKSDLRLLLLHELTHIMQFAYTEGRGLLRLGLVGETVATPPPAWLIEGLAVWTESEFTGGGRRDDALTRGLVESIALSGRWPTLSDASLTTYGGWPGAQTQYLFGVGFTAHLIERHGFEAVRESLRVYNAGGVLRSFSASWKLAVGTDLEAEWRAWRRAVMQAAEARSAGVKGELGDETLAGISVTETGWYTRAPAPSPDGSRLAWVGWPASIRLARVGPEGALQNPRTLIDDRLPTRLEWLGAHVLLYARTALHPGGAASELFALDTRTGKERRLTFGAGAKLPAVTPEGCVLFVWDTEPARAELRQWCDGRIDTFWRTPAGVHPVGLAVSAEGRVALSVWRAGAVRLALLEAGALRFLTPPGVQALEPAWRGETRLVFRAEARAEDVGAEGVFELFELSLETQGITRLTRSVGGAFTPAVAALKPEQGLWYTALGAEGYDLAFLPPGAKRRVTEPFALANAPVAAGASSSASPSPFPVRPYAPLGGLGPYGWLPSFRGLRALPFGVAAEATLFAQDDSADHGLSASLGLDSDLGALGGLYGYGRYDYGAGEALRAVPRALRFGVQLGAWPYTAHLSATRRTAFGVRGSLSARLPLDLYTVGLGLEADLVRLLGNSGGGQSVLELRAQLSLLEERGDAWGYPTRGGRAALYGVRSFSEDASSRALGVWSEARYSRTAEGAGVVEAGLLAGYRPRWPFPTPPETELVALTSLGLRRSFPVELRYGDGLYALERVTLEPRVRLWVDDTLRLGGDLTASLDAVLGYNSPVSVGVTAGYAEGFWFRVGPRAPF